MARAMDAAGVDRVVVSDHLVFGENLDAYGDPRSAERKVAGSRRVRTAIGWSPLSS